MFQSGRAIVQARLENTSKPFAEAEAVTSQLATGGALATGTVGIYDRNGSSTAITRYYDNVQAAIPVTESIVAYANRGIEIRSDGVDRESSAGGTWGRPQRYAGS